MPVFTTTEMVILCCIAFAVSAIGGGIGLSKKPKTKEVRPVVCFFAAAAMFVLPAPINLLALTLLVGVLLGYLVQLI